MIEQKKVVVYLSGGLGNQLFQYAAAKSFAHHHSARLYLDTWSGFCNDKIYQRKFFLDVLQINANIATPLQRIPFWIDKVQKKFNYTKFSLYQDHFWGGMIVEINPRKYLGEIYKVEAKSNTWILGSWQSENYFHDIRDLIGEEYKIPEPTDNQFLEMADMINSCDSIAIGVRLYEEIPRNIYSIYQTGWLTNFSFYEEAANKLVCQLKNPVFFVFSTANVEILKKINLPGKVYYITPDSGFEEAHKCLWLLTQCQHHIVSNSSFYWWGAWLAEYKNPGTRVIASHCFSNQDSVPERWMTLGDSSEIQNLPYY